MEKNEWYNMSALHTRKNDTINHFLNTNLLMMQMTKSKDKSSIVITSTLTRKTNSPFVCAINISNLFYSNNRHCYIFTLYQEFYTITLIH